MSKRFQVNHIVSESNLAEGKYIVLVNAHAIPPHIAVIENGEFLSLEYDDLKIRSLPEFLRFVDLKRLPIFAVQLNSEDVTFKENFLKWDAIKEGETCIAPILLSLKSLLDNDHASILSVLEELDQKKRIGTKLGINLMLDANNNYVFPTYSQKEIFDRIELLNASKKSEPHT